MLTQIKKFLLIPKLSKANQRFLLDEYCIYAKQTVLLGIIGFFVFIWYEASIKHNTAYYIYFVLMLLVQIVRYATANLAQQHANTTYRRLFFGIDYLSALFWVAYPSICGWGATTSYEVLSRMFVNYSYFGYYLIIMRHHLPSAFILTGINFTGSFIYVLFGAATEPHVTAILAIMVLAGNLILLFFSKICYDFTVNNAKLIEQNEKLIGKMDSMLTIDELTKQHNRRYFNTQLTKHLELHKIQKRPFSLALVDIDLFKQVNDSFGHDVGDVMLVKISQFIKKNIRNTDIFARYGGEEFVIIFAATSQHAALKVIEKMRKACASEIHMINGLEMQATISIGLTEVQEQDAEDLILKRADLALYRAKENGRNRTEVFTA
jgi:diguanylate cyclase (GGDEF)-like protein